MKKKQTAGQTPVRVAVKDLPTIRIDELIPYENNAKIHGPEQIEQLRRSLREFGSVSPVLIDEDKNLIAGHGRVEAARAEGMTEVPYVTVSDLTDAQRRAYIIADNRLAETGEWDAARLKVARSRKFQSASTAVKLATLEKYFDVGTLFGRFTPETLPSRYLRTYAKVEKMWGKPLKQKETAK